MSLFLGENAIKKLSVIVGQAPIQLQEKTITIKDGVIKAQDAGAKITWRKWTE